MDLITNMKQTMLFGGNENDNENDGMNYNYSFIDMLDCNRHRNEVPRNLRETPLTTARRRSKDFISTNNNNNVEEGVVNVVTLDDLKRLRQTEEGPIHLNSRPTTTKNLRMPIIPEDLVPVALAATTQQLNRPLSTIEQQHYEFRMFQKATAPASGWLQPARPVVHSGRPAP